MTDEFRPRQPLDGHYTITSNIILFGYEQLTDAEKVTYQVLASFDWSDRAGKRKGYIFPSVRRLAALRRLDVRTIFRHINALERIGLVTREQRVGRPSILWIEEPSKGEAERYLSTIRAECDADVTPTPDSDVVPYKETHEMQEDQISVNGQQGVSGREGDLSVTRKTEAGDIDDEDIAKREYYAGEILAVTEDRQSLGCYRRIAARCPPDLIFEALSLVKEARTGGVVRRTKGALFVDLVKRSCQRRRIELGFNPPRTAVRGRPRPPQLNGP